MGNHPPGPGMSVHKGPQRRKIGLAVLILLGAIDPAAGCRAAGSREDGEALSHARESARAVVEAHLSGIERAAHGKLTSVASEDLSTSFEGVHFFALRFQRFPRAIVPGSPLRSNNLFAVHDATLEHVTGRGRLEQLFRERLAPVHDAEAAAAAVRSWLQLARELHQDGYFSFEAPSVDATAEAASGTLRVVPTRGNQGELTVWLSFTDGRLDQVETGGRLLSGIRPRCQATLLLDPDPAVREIMRRDLLVMGSAARVYLDEVRATASPELRRAIDDVWDQIVREGR